jgi:hypothetical protein
VLVVAVMSETTRPFIDQDYRKEERYHLITTTHTGKRHGNSIQAQSKMQSEFRVGLCLRQLTEQDSLSCTNRRFKRFV